MGLRSTRELVEGQTEIDGYIPLGKKALIKGAIAEPFIVDVGADTLLEMSREETLRVLDAKLVVETKGGKEDERIFARDGLQPFEIIEEMDEDDLELLEKKGKPRVAHAATGQAKKKIPATPPVTLAEELATLEVGPLKSRVIERTDDGRPIVDPGETVIGLQVKESLFKRRSALSPSVRGGDTQFRAPERQ